MKTAALFIGLLLANFSFAQQYDIEDQESNVIIAETNKNILKITINDPLQVAVKNCKDFKAANVTGGVHAYTETLRRYMFNYLNSEFYVLNGDFTFTLTINEMGKITKIEGSPKVNNSEVFFDDMKFIMRRIKNVWTPATCDAKPVTSEIKIKMNFNSVATDV
ncbi:hypothetical protein ASG31_02200 [Chryseobacterium sp. Leaf404]|uniref:hypothetical protein n=1 Tax=unclassified Chryseobacterium TaxID=2593645 RepID=UPI0006FB6822|nr:MULTISPECIES: hypothetical protein [unclassified Chryseobacterium]KQT22176.1 hypothetical protein ASG31_02200 [Chryseobacterium sp. Leaf404]